MNNRDIPEEIGNNKVKTGDLGHILPGGFKRYRYDEKFDGEGFWQGRGGYSIKGGNLMSSLGGNEGGNVFLTMAAEQPFALLGREMGGYTPVPVREGVFRNEEIGKVFGLSYSALSHIVRDVKEQVKKDARVGSKAKRVNSQFKM